MGSRRFSIALAFATTALALPAPSAGPAAACCQPAEPQNLPAVVDAVGAVMAAFADYKARYVEEGGRVVDNANGHISHSEGQGYAMLIAAKLGDRETFDEVWGWARENLMVREDNLLAWKWDPTASPNVVDLNNATDGDLLVVWALVSAARLWEEPSYLEAARDIALDISTHNLSPSAYGDVFLPGATGFSAEEREDGPVVNLSYWVFPALEPLQAVAPEIDWAQVFANGRAVLEASDTGLHGLPPEWTSLAAEGPAPAAGFPPVFGYNAIRIPLYLAWSGRTGPLLERFSGLHDPDAGVGPFVIDLETGAAVKPLREAGFRAVATLVECALDPSGEPAHRIAASTEGGLYYPDTLNLLSLIAQLETYPSCL